MGYTIWYENDGLILYNKYFSSISLAESRESIAERMTDIERFKNVRIMVIDFLEANMKQVSSQDIRDDADMTKEMANINPDIDFIAIVPNLLEYGLGRMWQILTDEVSWRSHLVKSKEEADQLIDSIVVRDI